MNSNTNNNCVNIQIKNYEEGSIKISYLSKIFFKTHESLNIIRHTLF